MKNLAEKYHKGQFRRGKGKAKTPYIVHPRAVAETLISWGVAPDSPLISIAWGHDLLEDTQATREEILAVSGKEVLAAIKILTKPEDMDKNQYMQNVAGCGKKEVLLVKMADRLCNSRDFITLEGKLYAYQYLHKADCLLPALGKFAWDPIVQKALGAWEELENSLKTDAERDIIRGCMLGGAVGDALGAPVEFMDLETIHKKYGKDGVQDYVEFPDGSGSITDDTQMALFTAEGILRANTRNHVKGIACLEGVVHYACLRWLKTQGILVNCNRKDLESGWLIKEKALFQRRAPGNTCITALRENDGTNEADNDSKGCGTVMRMAPAGLMFTPEDAYEMGCRFSAITHGHPTGITSGGAFAMLIAYLRYGRDLPESLALVEAHLRDIPEAKETLAAIRKAQRAENITELGEGWVAEEALAIGIYCALKNMWDFQKGVLEAVNITGDSDSTGSIAGNILGALNGEKAIPAKWRKKLQERSIVSKIANDLHTGYETNEEGHVKPSWWRKYPGF